MHESGHGPVRPTGVDTPRHGEMSESRPRGGASGAGRREDATQRGVAARRVRLRRPPAVHPDLRDHQLRLHDELPPGDHPGAPPRAPGPRAVAPTGVAPPQLETWPATPSTRRSTALRRHVQRHDPAPRRRRRRHVLRSPIAAVRPRTPPNPACASPCRVNYEYRDHPLLPTFPGLGLTLPRAPRLHLGGGGQLMGPRADAGAATSGAWSSRSSPWC